jgi:hypothetical protein
MHPPLKLHLLNLRCRHRPPVQSARPGNNLKGEIRVLIKSSFKKRTKGRQNPFSSQPSRNGKFDMKTIQSLLTLLCSLGILFLTGQAAWTSDSRITVYGIGYPPVKAQNKAQALLMAKRAALLDAYRKALSGQEDYAGPHEEGESFYRGFSGFVKGLTITQEEYLNDGGVKIEATVSKQDISLSDKEKYPKGKRLKTGPTRMEGPRTVTVEEWYKIIEKMVNFENKDLKKGE